MSFQIGEARGSFGHLAFAKAPMIQEMSGRAAIESWDKAYKPGKADALDPKPLLVNGWWRVDARIGWRRVQQDIFSGSKDPASRYAVVSPDRKRLLFTTEMPGAKTSTLHFFDITPKAGPQLMGTHIISRFEKVAFGQLAGQILVQHLSGKTVRLVDFEK